jgi:hypothetical protein
MGTWTKYIYLIMVIYGHICIMEEVRYLGTGVTNQNYIHREMKSRLHMGNAFCHAGESLYFPLCIKKYKD